MAKENEGKCPECQGKGEVEYLSDGKSHWKARRCEKCNGTGKETDMKDGEEDL